MNSRTINNEEEKENEFDNILRDINKRKLMINHPIKVEDNIQINKKKLSKLGRTKSKTEMLIKELHETFFGKDNNQSQKSIINPNNNKGRTKK